MLIRPAVEPDLVAILEIYNHYVVHSTATFDLEPRSLETGRDWLLNRTARHPVIVAEADGNVVGWASLSPWSHHGGYRNTAEVSVYVHPEGTGRGTGHRLMAALLETGRQLGQHCLIARICTENPRSRSFHEKAGFEIIGTMREAGQKQGRQLDVVLLQMIINS
jgi:L-amino acid N-acyltransferase YncA